MLPIMHDTINHLVLFRRCERRDITITIIIMCGGHDALPCLNPQPHKSLFISQKIDPLLLLLWCSEIVLFVTNQNDNSLIG